MTPELWSLSYSPWSERARWALDHGGVEYRKRSYRPLIDELALRRAVGRWRGPVSVPILVTGDGVMTDSHDIARYADAHATTGARLIPDVERVADYNQLADRGMNAGRACSLTRVLGNDQSLRDLVPSGMRKLLGPLARTVAATGVRRTLRKYAAVTPEDPSATLVEVLEALRADLATADSGPAYLLGEFSYADITVAQVLAFVEPPVSGLRLSEANRASYRDPELAERFADLVDWRDALYAAHREPSRG